MAQNITLLGATYNDVPAVELPKSGGGTASFTDVTGTTAIAGDVAQGKYFFTASGVLTLGTNTGGGGSAIVINDTTDPIAGGTIREITAVSLAGDTVQASKMFSGYTAHDSLGTPITGTFTGTEIPQGWALYNGYLLPQVPTGDGYDYYWIRANGSTGNFDLVRGKSQWSCASNSGLNAWSLSFTNMTTLGAWQYSIPMDSSEHSTPASNWGTVTVSTASSYGTGNNRKPIFTSHDIMIAGQSNILLRHGFAIYPTTS